MNFSIHGHLLLVLLIFLSLSGCAAFLGFDPGLRGPVPTDSNVAIVGIAVQVKHFLKNDTCGRGIFIKLEEAAPDDIMRGQILSNTRYDPGYTYLPNVKPGRYSAVGCIATGKYGYPVFFNKPLIARLMRTISPGTVVLLGKITVDVNAIRNESQFDEVQQHYFREFMGKDTRQALDDHQLLGHQFPLGAVSASLDHEDPIDSASQQFLNVLSEDLPKSWQPWLNNGWEPGL